MGAISAQGLRRAPRPPLPPGPYLVAGLGRAGRAATRLLIEVETPDAVTVWDAADRPELRRVANDLARAGVRHRLGGDGVAALGDSRARCVVKSPGIPIDSPLFVAAMEQGIEVVDELELAWRYSPLPMIGITGTKGKSTVTTLVAAIARAGAGSAHMAGNTDFAPAWSAVRAAEGIAVCEVSSNQIEGCVALLPDVAVLTNVQPETNRHGSVEATAAIKRRLFVRGDRCAATAVLNVDDPCGRELVRMVDERGGRVMTYGRSSEADYRVADVRWTIGASTVALDTPQGRISLTTRAPGTQNAVNAAAAIATADVVGLPLDTAAGALAEVAPPPGRFERVDAGQPFDVVVDMAHTPGSIEECLTTLRAVVEHRPGASLRAVVGIIGSNAVAAPREETGRVARRLADHLILAGSSLRGEPPLLNLASVLRGARTAAGAELDVVLDRRAAVGLAISRAQPGDVVVILGRGPVPDMSFDRHGGGYARSDMEIARDLLQAWSAR